MQSELLTEASYLLNRYDSRFSLTQPRKQSKVLFSKMWNASIFTMIREDFFFWTWPVKCLFSSTLCPGGRQVFPLILSLHYLSSLSHQGHSTSPHHLPPPTTTRSPRWRIMCCYLILIPNPVFCSSVLLPQVRPFIPNQWQDTMSSDLLHCKTSIIT